MHDRFCLLGVNANVLSLDRIYINKDLGIQFYYCWFFFYVSALIFFFYSAGDGTQRLIDMSWLGILSLSYISRLKTFLFFPYNFYKLYIFILNTNVRLFS